ncbi:hypothetical protein D9M72_587110 [compost metagenome]
MGCGLGVFEQSGAPFTQCSSGAHEGGQERRQGAGALLHSGLDLSAPFRLGFGLGAWQRDGCRPDRPPLRFLMRPFGDVTVEGADGEVG